jgi:D-cysteine desulfhydrase
MPTTLLQQISLISTATVLTSLLLKRAASTKVSAIPSRVRISSSKNCQVKDTSGPVPVDIHQYIPPTWASKLKVPTHQLKLGHLPTPIHRWNIPIEQQSADQKVQFYIKRDDYSGSEMSGNKVRKLEFLLADALRKNCDSVITVGGIQSNHCRATAVACARVGLKAHLVLRTSNSTTQDPGYCGNLLVSRLVDATLHLVSTEDYMNHPQGGWGIVQDLQKKLESSLSSASQSSSCKPYPVPSGGSCSLGVWGYIEAVREILEHCNSDENTKFDRIYFACGSGGTAAGLALGMHLSGMSKTTELVAVGVDDDPDFFYEKIDRLISSLISNNTDLLNGKTSRDLLRVIDGVGAGYAESTDQELLDIYQLSKYSGVVLDPVYSGKAALTMLKDLKNVKKPQNVLFIHTGGLLGFYSKMNQLNKVVERGKK